MGLKTLKKDIEPYQNFTGFYKEAVEVLDELQNPWNTINLNVKMYIDCGKNYPIRQ